MQHLACLFRQHPLAISAEKQANLPISLWARGQCPSPTSLWRVEEAGPFYSLPSRAYASRPAGLAWLWLETNGQGGGVNETLRDEVDVVCQSSLSHQNAT